jgi:membrane protein
MFEDLHGEGVILGLSTIAIIAFSRWLCIKAEYYFTKRFWIAFLILGLTCIVFSFCISDHLYAAIVAIAGFCFLWGIGEIIQQEKRVAMGWFPANPRRVSKKVSVGLEFQNKETNGQ